MLYGVYTVRPPSSSLKCISSRRPSAEVGPGGEETYYAYDASGNRTAVLAAAEAVFNLGVVYFKGDGVREDKAEARKWYEKAAEAGNAEAMSSLGPIVWKRRETCPPW